MPYFPVIQEEQYPATDETQCIQIIIPAGDEFKALLSGLIASASDVNNYANPDSVAAEGQAAIWDTAYSLIDWLGCYDMVAPQIWYDLWGRDVLNNTANPVSIVINNNQIHNYYVLIPSPAINQQMYWNYIDLIPGDWKLTIDYVKRADAAIVDFYFSDMAGAGTHNIDISSTLDMYGATTVNQQAVFDFTVVTADSYRCTLTAGAKNASSSNYNIPITRVRLNRP